MRKAPVAMDEHEYRRRIAALEAYCDRRMFAADYRQRWWPSLAHDALSALSEAVDADYYGVARPAFDGDSRPWFGDLLRSVITELDSRVWRPE